MANTIGTSPLPPRYTGAKRVATGGMAEVWCATDSTLGRPVAVKLLDRAHATDDELRGRFLREARAAARLAGDRNIVDVYDVGEWDERPYIVMQYLEGGSLEDALRRDGPPPPATALAWIEEAAAALDHAHAQGVVHRDVKPGNLLLDAHGRVHVADFGIASATGLSSFTRAGTIMGTAGYLAPEQARGEQTTSASDRYALGVVAYELLTGRRPFAKESPTAELTAHVNAPVPPVPHDLPPALDDVFARALAKQPQERYATAADLAAALRDAYTRSAATTRLLVPAAAPVAAGTAAAIVRNRSIPLGVAALAALLLVALVTAAALLPHGGSHPAATAGKPATTNRTPVAHTTPVTTPTTTAAPATDGDALNLQGYALMKEGRWAEALPILQQAVAALQGTGPADINEGYANYNLGVTLIQLGRCAEAIPYLQHAQALEPDRTEVPQALATAEHCASPAPAPHGHDRPKKHGKHH